MAQSNLKIVIDAINQAQGDLNALKGQLTGLEEAGKKGGAGIGEAGNAVEQLTGMSLTGMGAIAALGGALKFSLDEAMAAERQMAATAAVIKSTGGAAGMTVQNVMDLASAEQALTGIQDDVVGGGINMLLTFKNISGDTMPRATRAMEDMAAAMSGGDIAALDLKGTAIQLGKALNDPIQGLAALGRVGVSFTAEQEKLIRGFVEMGDVASAQAIILQELESEFGGMAEAMGETSVGKIQKAQNALGDLGETIGSQLLPVLGDAAEAFTLLITMDGRIEAAQQQHAQAVAKTSSTYEEYIAEIVRARNVVGASVDENGDLVTSLVGEYETTTQVIVAQAALTKVQWENQRATEAQIASSQSYVQAETVNIESLKRNADAYNAMLRARGAVTASITTDAISLGDAERKRAEIEADLANIDRQIAANGAVRTVSIRNEKMSTEELAVAQAKLGAATEDLSRIKRGANESEAEYALRVAQAQAAVADLNAKLGEHTVIVGGATAEQIKQKDALQATLVEMQRTAEIEAAKSAFQALNDALVKGVLSENDYRDAMSRMNDATGLFSDQALETATNSALMNEAIRSAKVPDDVITAVLQYGGALGAAAQAQLAFGQWAATPSVGAEEAARGYQTGADFVVPAGYPNDTFPMRVSSGERVTVVPAGGGNTNYHNSSFNTTINDPRTGAAFMAWLRQQQQPNFERG